MIDDDRRLKPKVGAAHFVHKISEGTGAVLCNKTRHNFRLGYVRVSFSYFCLSTRYLETDHCIRGAVDPYET